MPSKYQHLKTRLLIEQTRMFLWGDKVGLLEDQLESPSHIFLLNRNLVLDVLLEVQAAFKSAVKITKNFDQFVHPKEIPQQQADGQAVPLALLQKNAKSNPTLVSRLKWAMVKQDRYQYLITKLIEYNDRMESFLDRSTLEELHANQQRSNLMLIQVTEQLDQLQALFDAVKLAPRVSQQADIASLHTSFASSSLTLTTPNIGTSDFLTLVEFKLQQETEHMQTMNITPLPLDLIFPDGFDQDEIRSFTKVHGKSYWIEWTEPVPNVPAMPNLEQILEDRVAKLAAILGVDNHVAKFHSPKCAGFVRNDSHFDGPKFGLVYEYPHSQEQPQITSLLNLIFSEAKPSLNERLMLAFNLAEALMYLHAVGWLHKGLRSDSILFITSPSKSSRRPPSLQNPVVSGFSTSRPDLPSEITVKYSTYIEHDLYRHPDLLVTSNSRHQKIHDIYSLGLILLEIAFWRPIEEMLDLDLTSKSARAEVLKIRNNVSYKLRGDYSNLEDRLAAEVGNSFAKACLTCIRSDELIRTRQKESTEFNDDKGDGKILQVFHDEVFLKLKECRL